MTKPSACSKEGYVRVGILHHSGYLMPDGDTNESYSAMAYPQLSCSGEACRSGCWRDREENAFGRSGSACRGHRAKLKPMLETSLYGNFSCPLMKLQPYCALEGGVIFYHLPFQRQPQSRSLSLFTFIWRRRFE